LRGRDDDGGWDFWCCVAVPACGALFVGAFTVCGVDLGCHDRAVGYATSLWTGRTGGLVRRWPWAVVWPLAGARYLTALASCALRTSRRMQHSGLLNVNVSTRRLARLLGYELAI